MYSRSVRKGRELFTVKLVELCKKTNKLHQNKAIEDKTLRGALGAALQQGILIRREVSDREVYYQPGAKMYEQQLDFDG